MSRTFIYNFLLTFSLIGFSRVLAQDSISAPDTTSAELTRAAETLLIGIVEGVHNPLTPNGDLQRSLDESAADFASGLQSNYRGAFDLYPFSDRERISVNPNQRYFLLRGSELDFSQTHTLLPNYHIVSKIDSAGNYTFEDRYGNSNEKLKTLRKTTVISRQEYIRQNFINQVQNTFSKTVVTSITTQDESRSGAVRVFSASVTTNETFQKIFGGDEVTVDASGNINLNVSGSSEKTSNKNTNTGRNSTFTPKFEQKQKFLLRGTIGKKVEILFDQDSEREFSFENNIKLTYTGFDDEILQKLEAGNIDLSLPGTDFIKQENKGLFGVKTIFKFADLNLTAIASIQNGEKSTLQFKSGDGTKKPVSILSYQYTQNRFFFLDIFYRNGYENVGASAQHVLSDPNREITSIEVYRSLPAGNQQNRTEKVFGKALYDNAILTNPNLKNLPESELKKDTNYISLFFERLSRSEYQWEARTGTLFLNSALADGEALGVYYTTQDLTSYGYLGTDSVIIKLLKRPTQTPSDSTWNLEMKNIYDLGAPGMSEEDAKSLAINIRLDNKIFSSLDVGSDSRGIMDILHIDVKDQSGADKSDNVVDFGSFDGNRYGLDLTNGWLIFPKLRPFDPDENLLGDYFRNEELFVDSFRTKSLRFKDIYDKQRTTVQDAENRNNNLFTIEFSTSQRGFHIQLPSTPVLEGSEQVSVNGRTLVKDVGYTINYFDGAIELLDAEARVPSADIKIDYESAQLFQVDKRSIFGARAEYNLSNLGLSQNSFIGSTALFQSQSTINKRVQLTEEPFTNFIWDVNTNLDFEANYLTKFANWIPLVSTTQQSKINIAAEYAKLFPNPNTSNGLIKQDENGVAYLDDFEAIKRTYPLSTNRRTWILTSMPKTNITDITQMRRRGHLIWFQENTPRQQFSLLKTNSADNAITLTLALEPKPDEFGDYTSSWGGIIRGLPENSVSELSQSRFIEFWLKNRSPNQGDAKINFDLGTLSEDQNGNGGTPDKEVQDKNKIGVEVSEDIGLDGLNDDQEADTLASLGIALTGELTPRQQEIIDSLQVIYPWGLIRQDPKDPFGDNLDESQTKPGDATIHGAINQSNLKKIKVNGLENNRDDNVIRVGDTEDLNANGGLDTREIYARYTISSNPLHNDPNIIKSDETSSGWTLYRIPLLKPSALIGTDSLKAALGRIVNARIWITPDQNDPSVVAIQIAELQLISGEWKLFDDSTGLILSSQGLSIPSEERQRIVEISSVSTDEGGYHRPPSVKREKPVDQTGANSAREIKEQSLLLKLDGLPAQSRALIKKNITNSDLRNYGRIRMFVHGDQNTDLPEEHQDTTVSRLNYFIRIGNQITDYYEIEKPLFANWAESKNSLDIDLQSLTFKKFSTGGDTVRTFTDKNGQIIRIRGNPSFQRISQIYLGVYNTDDLQPYTGDIWFDELRVIDAENKSGEAAKAKFTANFGDFASFNGNIEYRTAEFRGIEERFNANSGDSRSWSFAGSIGLQKFYLERWGINLPFNFNMIQSLSKPKFVPNDDILVSTAKASNDARLPELQTAKTTADSARRQWIIFHGSDTTLANRLLGDSLLRDSIAADSAYQLANSFEDRMNSSVFSRGFSLNFSKNKTETDFWLIRFTVNNITSNFNYSETEQRNPQTARRIDKNWSSDSRYSLPLSRRNFRPLSWFPGASLPFVGVIFKNISESDFNYGLITNVSTDFRITSTYSDLIQRDAAGRPLQKPKTTTLTGSRGYSLAISPLQALSSTLAVSYSTDLKGLSSSQILQGVAKGFNPFDGFSDFTFKSDPIQNTGKTDTTFIYNRDNSVTNNFSLNYSPLSFSFVNHSATYTAQTSSRRRIGSTSEFNQDISLSRRLQFDTGFSLRGFIGSVKEPFGGKTSAPANRDDPKRNRRDRFKESTGTGFDSGTHKDSTSESKGFSVSAATRKAGSVLETALNTVKDITFNIGFENRATLSGLDQRLTPGATWFGYTTTENSGFVKNIFSFELDTIRQFDLNYNDPAIKNNFNSSYGKTINYGSSYGFNFNYFTLDMRYDRTETRTLSNYNKISATIQESDGFPLLKKFPFPFFDMTFRASNIGKWPIFNLLSGLTKSMNVSVGYVAKKNMILDENTGNGITFFRNGEVDESKTHPKINGRKMQVTEISRTETFPQINYDISWNGNFAQNITFGNTSTKGVNKSNRITANSKNLTSILSWSKRGGFRIPIWFLSKRQLDNEIRFSTSFNYRVSNRFTQTQKTTAEAPQQPKRKTEETTSWSIEPKIDYSFTKWITGGTFFLYESTKNLTTGKITRTLFGLNVNIVIGA